MLDLLRGTAIIAMIIYHSVYSMAYIFNIQIAYSWLSTLEILKPVSLVFIFICGISTRFSRSNLKRGFLLLLVALTITAVTLLIMPNEVIYFGVLHMLALSILLFVLCRPLLDKINPFIGMIIFAVVFVLTLHISEGYLGIENIFKLNISLYFYSTSFLFPIGLQNVNFISSDYFPLIPYFFIFISGTYLGVYLKRGSYPKFLNRRTIKPIEFIGRHSLIIYIMHQPIIIAIIYLITEIFKGAFV